MRRSLRGLPAVLAILALVYLGVGAGVAVSQDDCHNDCSKGGIWDDASLTCDVGVHVNCTACEVVCDDSGGDGGPGDPLQDNP